MTDMFVEGSWVYLSTGESLVYTSWKEVTVAQAISKLDPEVLLSLFQGQPNDYGSGEDYALLNRGGEWVDRAGSIVSDCANAQFIGS